jgi:ribosome biogenesis ATPase
MDGVDGRESVYVIAATNRPDMIDPAMLRPGRLDKLMYVPLPTAEQRVLILETIGRKYPLDPTVDLRVLAHDHRMDGFSGADLASFMREASLTALKVVYDAKNSAEIDDFEKGAADEELPTILPSHFEDALRKVRPSVSMSDRTEYEEMHRLLRQQHSA